MLLKPDKSCGCPDKKGLKTAAKTCQNCLDSNCKTCANNSLLCTVCMPTFTKQGTNCNCLDGQVLHIATTTCKNCLDPNCKVCGQDRLCTQCKTGYELDGTFCRKICLPGEGLKLPENNCYPCADSNCEKCDDNTLICNKCNPTYSLLPTKFCKKDC